MDKNLTAALLIIGNEILSGRTQDVNASWIAIKLAERGIRLLEIRVVPDVEEAIIEAVNALRSKFGSVFTTGGIGPTHDDITTETIAKAFGVGCEVHEGARQALITHYGGELELTAARLKMARIPEGAALIANPVSGAPGFHIGNVFVMAGVPVIMRAMLDGVLPQLVSADPILSNTVTCDLQESLVAQPLEAIQRRYAEVEIGSYPHFRAGSMGLSLVLKSSKNVDLHAATGEVVAMVRSFGVEPRAVSVKSAGEALI